MKFIKTEKPYFIALKDEIVAMRLNIDEFEGEPAYLDIVFKSGTTMTVEFLYEEIELAKKLLEDFERD